MAGGIRALKNRTENLGFMNLIRAPARTRLINLRPEKRSGFSSSSGKAFERPGSCDLGLHGRNGGSTNPADVHIAFFQVL